MEHFRIFLLISVVVLFIFVFYRWLKRYLHRNEITVPFAHLFPFEKPVFSGIEIIKMDMSEPHAVRVEVLDSSDSSDSKYPYIAFDGRLRSGIVEINIDLTSLKSGSYTLRIILPDQNITRYIQIENEVP